MGGNSARTPHGGHAVWTLQLGTLPGPCVGVHSARSPVGDTSLASHVGGHAVWTLRWETLPGPGVGGHGARTPVGHTQQGAHCLSAHLPGSGGGSGGPRAGSPADTSRLRKCGLSCCSLRSKDSSDGPWQLSDCRRRSRSMAAASPGPRGRPASRALQPPAHASTHAAAPRPHGRLPEVLRSRPSRLGAGTRPRSRDAERDYGSPRACAVWEACVSRFLWCFYVEYNER